MLNVLQQGFRKREARVPVLLPARMKRGSAWVDATIHNVSSRGMLVATNDPPDAGAYVDIRRGSNVMIGRVAWRKDRFFGVRTQDRIDLPALQRPPQRPGAGPSAGRSPDASERRSADRSRSDAAVARRLERNRTLSHLLQFTTLGLFAAIACAGLAMGVYNVLRAPAALIQNAMAPRN